MTGAEVRKTLTELGIRPSRKLGQNFLVDTNMRDALISDAQPQPGECILEIGAGLGAMTEKLLDAKCEVVAVEFDHRLADYLQHRFGEMPGFSLVQGDACKLDYKKLLGEIRYRCIANLPYSCGTIILAELLKTDNPPHELFVLLQKEMGKRLAAEPSTKAYGALTIQVRNRYKVDILRRVKPGVFFPTPEVESAYIRLKKRNDCLVAAGQHQLFVRVVKAGFSQRRKRLYRLLENEFNHELVKELFEELGLNQNTRAEQLGVSTFNRITAEIAKILKRNQHKT